MYTCLSVVLLFLLAFLANLNAQKQCVPKYYNGCNDTVCMNCVCNSTYCDELTPLESLGLNIAAVYTTSRSGKRLERTTLLFDSSTTPSSIIIKTNETRRNQTVFGFGGAWTDAAVHNMRRLSDGARLNLLNAYFGPQGIGYTTGRVPIASCDFSLTNFSYAEVPNDFNLTHFALTQYDYIKIPLILQAKQISGGKLRLFASPWAPPGWMKTNEQMQGGAPLKGEVNGPYYQTFANYFVRFFEEYAKNNVTFWGVTMENEPGKAMDLYYRNEALFLNSTMERDFAKGAWGQALRNNPITKNLKLMTMDDNYYSYDWQNNRYDGIQRYADDIYGDPEASKIVDGMAIHWYADGDKPDIVSLIAAHEKYPDKFLLYTEACNLNAPIFGSWEEADKYAFSLIETLNSWVIGWTDWNMCLDPNGQPSWIDSHLESPIIVSNVSDEFEKQPMYYALGHVAKFIVPNSTIIGLEWENPIPELIGTAAITPSGEHVIFLNNRDNSTSHTVTVYNNKGGWTSLTLEPRSFTTVVYNVTRDCACPAGNWYQSITDSCNCYNFIQTSTDWQSSNNDCRQQNPKASLASIDSAFENNEILSVLKNQTSCSQAFIGLKQTSNSWSWINNDTSIYRNWRSGYPSSNSNNIYSQLNTADGKWTNIDGTAQGCYVCEVRA